VLLILIWTIGLLVWAVYLGMIGVMLVRLL
jgi:hypothetical protein